MHSPQPQSHGCPICAENTVCPDKLRHGRPLGQQSPSKHSRSVRGVSCIPELGATVCLKALTWQRPTLRPPGAEVLTQVHGPPQGGASSLLTLSAKWRGLLRGESTAFSLFLEEPGPRKS